MIYAILIGDLIDSTTFTPTQRDLILQSVEEAMEVVSDQKGIIFRGDSIQVQVDDPTLALAYALQIKATIKSIRFSERQRTSEVGMRLSIGLGVVEYQKEEINKSDGQAFHLAGHTLDQMKKSGQGLALTTAIDEINQTWEVILGLLDAVVDKWTISSAEVVRELLKNNNERIVSEHLGISQPAVNLRKRHAGWDAIKQMVDYYYKSSQSWLADGTLS